MRLPQEARIVDDPDASAGWILADRAYRGRASELFRTIPLR
jgi:hypothetical protein